MSLSKLSTSVLRSLCRNGTKVLQRNNNLMAASVVSAQRHISTTSPHLAGGAPEIASILEEKILGQKNQPRFRRDWSCIIHW